MSPALEPLVHNIAECAALLRVHRATISRLIAEGALPAVRIGSRTLIKRADLEKMLDELTTTGVPEAMAARGQRVRAARESKRNRQK
jgi:excisionase family DNA binding protein